MSRPIVWAAGTLFTFAFSAVLSGERLAARFGLSEAQGNLVQTSTNQGLVVTVAADLSGHFVIHPSLDGRRIRMLVDTGASLITLSHEDARMAGLQVRPHDFTRKILTANGVVEAAPVRIGEIRVGEIVVRNVDALVVPQGRLATSLLGMSFLKRLGGFEIARGQLTLKGRMND